MPLNIKPDPHASHDPDLTARIARVQRDRAQRIAALWACPILSDVEVPEVLHIPVSTWQLRKRSADAPPIFSIGKRSYCRTAELLARCERLKFIPMEQYEMR